MVALTKKYDELDLNNNTNLLIGNGFSMRIDSVFGKALLNSVEQDEIFNKIMNQLPVQSFEYMDGIFNNALIVLNEFDEKCFELVKEEKNRIKKIFLKAIINNHPQYTDVGNINDIQRIHDFLSRYNNIFTLNYDLMLYWILYIHATSGKRLNDGFGKYDNNFAIWKYSCDQNLFYLHGALHLSVRNGAIYKLKGISEEEARKSILTLIDERFQDQDYEPMVVFNGHSYNKLLEIENNDYLKGAYSYFKNAEGNLLVMGARLDSLHDRHISDAIVENKNLQNVYIGLFEDEENEIERYNYIFHRIRKKISFFDSNSISCWKRSISE